MFNLETYVTPILLSYLDKYVQNFKAGDAQVSLWGGGVTLHNLVLKAGVLQQEVALPFTLISGRIHELLIQVPWTKIMSEPIVVTINTIECILSLDAPPPDENAIPERRRSQVVEAPPGYMQALVRRIVSNISVRINSLIVKYVHDDIVMSLTVKRLAVDSVGADWEPLFADIDPEDPLIRRLVRLDDLTLCLDKCDSDGKIRFYQEPLLYRCQLDLRVLTRLISAKSRRASSFSVQLRSSLMSWGVTNEQLELLLRLCRDNALSNKTPSPVPKQLSQLPPLLSSSSNSAEPVRSASWSQWAWSWLPAWSDRESREETLAPSAPIPIMFVIYLEQVALGFKVLETELGRQRTRNILSLSAKDAVLKGSICSPTMLRIKFGARDLSLSSRGRCVCGYDNINTMKDEQTFYLFKTTNDNNEWKWKEDDFTAQKIEVGVAADEQILESPTNDTAEGAHIQIESQGQIAGPSLETDEEKDKFWSEMSPVIYVEMNHDRTPSDQLVNPYDNPPKDFEYSDWVEECVIKVTTQPITIKVCTDLLHRLKVIRNIYEQVSALQIPEPPMRTLTVEECEALSENLPQRRIGFEINGLRIQLIPWDHSLREKSINVPIVLALDVPKAVLNVAAPLYSHRVCSAACQMPYKSEPLWQGARLHVSGNMSLQAAICSTTETQPYPCLDANLNFVTHKLLHKDFFTSRRISDFNYTIKIREVKICGSSARLQAAYLVPVSLFCEQPCEVLNHTTLATDAMHDEEAVAIDVSLEELMVWGYRAKLIHTHILTLGSVKATAHHAPRGGDPKQVWLFSGPDTDTTTQYIRTRFQLCQEPTQDSVEYFGVWLEPTAICVDPLFGAWLAYKPKMKVTERRSTVSLTRIISSAQYLPKRRQTTPSSSGRGGSRSGSGTEQVHSRTRSQHSTHSGESEKKEIKPQNKQKIPEPRWPQQTLLKIYERLKRLLIAVEIGLVNVYVTSSSANATGCVTVRDAIERHAMASQNVLVVSLGHLSIISPSTKQFWERVEINGPTFLKPENEKPDNNTCVVDDAFPWRMRLADVSCYTLEARVGAERSGREKSAKGLKSQLKSTHQLIPRTVLDLVTTSITLSLVAKSLKIFIAPKKEKKLQELTTDDATKYFRSGIDFKPSSLKEFVRGPSTRGKASNPQAKENDSESPREETVKDGPIVSLGVNIHADTPPINVRVDHDQINVIAEAIHCCIHVLRLLQASPLKLAKQTKSSSSQGSLLRATSEVDTQSISLDAESIHPSEELISIFQAYPDREPQKLKTFLWFQWVVSHATLLVTTPGFRLAFDADDVISSLDMQDRYDQLKIKVASASIKHYERVNEDWLPGVLGGRVLEAREPTNATEESDFLSVTVTSVLISKLPASLNEELTLKSYKKIEPDERIWEIYVALAPLEAVLRPTILEPVVSVFRLFTPKNSCPLQNQENRPKEGHRPLIYVSAGGLRLLLTDQIDTSNGDDTIMFVLGKTTVNPYPQNPMCRNPINPAPENELISSLVIEGRQYEMLIKGLAVRSVQFQQLANHEVFQSELLKTSGENPALKWSQQIDSPVITPILHSMDINLLIAPPVYVMGALICGPALEVNLVTECSLELSLNRLNMMISTFHRLTETLERRESISVMQLEDNVCPYANLAMSEMSDASPSDCESTIIIEDPKTSIDIFSPIVRTDSGIVTSQSVQNTPTQKKSVDFIDYSSKSSEFLELWIAMWTIEISMYVNDDASPEVIALRPPVTYRPPPKEPQKTINEPTVKVIIEDRDDLASSMGASKSLTDTVRHSDIAKQNIDLASVLPMARKTEGNIPLWHVKLTLPNLYYYRRKNQRKIQASLFDLWVGLGAGESDGQWSSPLLTTGSGVVDPETGIEPALIRVEGVLAPRGGSDNECSPVKMDLERPLQVELSTDKMKRLKGILKLVQKKYPRTENSIQTSAKPPLDRFRRFLILNRVENITVKTSSIDLKSEMCSISCKISSLQLGAGKKPDRLTCKVLFCIQRVTVGPSSEICHLLQPMLVGVHLSATWEAWRRLENTLSAREPTIRLGIDLDQVILDIRPEDLDVVHKVNEALRDLMDDEPSEHLETGSEITSTDSLPIIIQSGSFINKPAMASTDSEVIDHFYSDDFRSGAFKIVKDGPVPMAYQILIQDDRVMWTYPHPRAITKLTISPIPDQDTDTECVLELYSSLLSRWERQAAFKIPISEVTEYPLEFKPSEAVFGCLWRVKVSSHHTTNPTNYKFDISKFLPGRDPMAYDPPIEMYYGSKAVTGQHLFGVLRIDSTFAPRVLPRLKLALKLSCFELNVHNTMPIINREARLLEGYYVSRPLCRSHRVANVRLTDTAAHLLIASTPKVVFDAELSSDILNSSTGTLEPFLEEFRTQGVIYLEQIPRLNVRAGKISIAMNVPRVYTVRALIDDWTNVYNQKFKSHMDIHAKQPASPVEALDGRVSLWVHNQCSVALRIGQEATKEVVPVGPGVSHAYRWRIPLAPKKLRFAFAGPCTDWHWSNSIDFKEGSCKVVLENLSEEGPSEKDAQEKTFVTLYVRIKSTGARRDMFLSGRVRLVNVLRQPLMYMVRYRDTTVNPWQTITAGVLNPETVGLSVLCGPGLASLKVKLTAEESGWSGDIPVQECRRRNLQWLVKIPHQGEVPFVAVWCRVVRGRSDGRFIATFWPLYMLTSELPLDMNMTITSDYSSDADPKPQYARIQTAPGRGACTHISTYGKSTDKNFISLQYRDFEYQVTKNELELRYENSNSPVFEEHPPVQTVDEHLDAIKQWLSRSGLDAKSTWPHTLVRNHWAGDWKPALLQPKTAINVCYVPVRVGGGCSLELRLLPQVLFANASTIALTLRSHDGAPVCKIEPGVAIAASNNIIDKPFYMSIEMGRETFVSTKFEVHCKIPGRYEEPSPKHIWLDRPTRCAIHCNQKVALLSLTLEIEESMYVFGITSSFAIRNLLKMELFVSTIGVPKEIEVSVLRPKSYKVIHPTLEDRLECVPLTQFTLQERWLGDYVDELNAFLCLSLDDTSGQTGAPVLLGKSPFRRPLALRCGTRLIPVVVCQQQHSGRWIITVAEDPCPQFLICNRTAKPLAIAEPENSKEFQLFVDSPQPVGIRECVGAKWWCVIEAKSSTYYSCPHYYNTYPPKIFTKSLMQQLLVGILREELDPDWSESFAVVNGETLIQLTNGVMIKLNIKSNPHTTLVELLDVDQYDLSASEIRRQLLKVEKPVKDKVENQAAISNYLSVHPKRTELNGKPRQKLQSAVSKRKKSLQNPPEQASTSKMDTLDDSSLANLSQAVKDDIEDLLEVREAEIVFMDQNSYNSTTWKPELWSKKSNEVDRIRALVDSVTITFAKASDNLPILALTLQRLSLWARENSRKQKATLTVANVHIDNTQYESGDYDFAVVATTDAPVAEELWPPLWNMNENMFDLMEETARLLLIARRDRWTAEMNTYNELTKLEARVGPLGLYIEDAFVSALIELARVVVPPADPCSDSEALSEANYLARPLLIQRLYIHPLQLTLTLHTAVRMYIALDQSPLHLSEFELLYVMTTQENLIRALTVHYLSAAILGAGWVVGGLELLGSPAAVAARVAEASGGLRGIASAASAALLRSLSACARSVARNLDILAGDEEHTRRAAAARRRQPPSLMAGIVDGVTNFAVTLLGAVGGLAHHPLLSVVVGETDSRVVGLRRGLVGAIAKPLSATADLVASAGHGILNQTGWDPVPQPLWSKIKLTEPKSSWRQNCVRWMFRLPEMNVLAGFDIKLGDSQWQLLLTDKYLVIFDVEADLVVESINLKHCSIVPWKGEDRIKIRVLKKTSKMSQARLISQDDLTAEMNPTAFARVARYTGATEEGEPDGPYREISFTPPPRLACSLHAALTVAIQQNTL